MPSLLYVYNMLPVIGAGDRFTDISIVPHPKGFRKVVEKVLQLRKGPLCEGAPAKRVGGETLPVGADTCIGPYNRCVKHTALRLVYKNQPINPDCFCMILTKCVTFLFQNLQFL